MSNTYTTETDATAKRFALLEIEDKPTAPVAVPAIRPDAPALVAGKDIVQAAKAKADEEQAMVQAIVGPSLKPQLFSNGTKMLECGEEVARQDRKRWEEQPLLADACDSIVGMIEAEKRRDYAVALRDVHVDARGLLVKANGGLDLNTTAWNQLVAKAPRKAALRHNVNTWLPESNAKGVFRTRNPDLAKGTRDCYAVVSDRYAVCDFDAVAKAVKAHLPKEAHATYTYEGAQWQIQASIGNPIEVDEMGVGRMLRVLAVIDGADDGTAKLQVTFKALRIRCINCTTVQDENLMWERVHVGSPEELYEGLKFGVRNASAALEGFAKVWSEANAKRIHDRYDGTPLGARDVFQRLVSHGYLEIEGVSDRELVERLMRAWHREPGDTAAAMSNAITNAAHREPWQSAWTTTDLEDQAGELLYQRVYQLDPMTEEQAKRFA